MKIWGGTWREFEAAFAELVTRHASAVYGSALRQVRDPHLAQEVVQAGFILLARKASGFKPGVVLTGWLFRATHFAANDLLKAEYRRHRRETAAYRMNPTDESTPAPATEESLWERVSPVLDHCLAKLGELDRHAILLRFFENKPLAEVGQALGIAEDAEGHDGHIGVGLRNRHIALHVAPLHERQHQPRTQGADRVCQHVRQG